MRRSRFFLFIGAAAILTCLLIFLDGCSIEEGKTQQTKSSYAVIDEAVQLIEKRAVFQVEGDKLVEGALRGMADTIGDPYSTYFTQEEAEAHRESLAGERIGIGAEITRSNGKFIIVAPVKGSPAEKAGLQPYDEIVRIDGQRLEGASLQDVVKRIRGKAGTAVTMTVYRPELHQHLELSIIREVVSVKTVEQTVLHVKDVKIGYVTITTFGEETAKEWKKATDHMLREGVEALIVDVRGNPGGYLHSVGEIISSLLQEDTVFAYMQDADGALQPLVSEKSETLTFDRRLQTIPVVLLQNKGSASASEVLAAALKELQRAFVMGTVSFGKGTVQETVELSNGGELKLTTSKWLTPKEQWIHGKGIQPNLEVEQSPLFSEHIRMVTERYEREDFAEDIAYAQKLLSELGYSVGREDGYFDASTERAVELFRADEQLEGERVMDRAFYTALKKRVENYRANLDHDEQLQMAIGYLFQKN